MPCIETLFGNEHEIVNLATARNVERCLVRIVWIVMLSLRFLLDSPRLFARLSSIGESLGRNSLDDCLLGESSGRMPRLRPVAPPCAVSTRLVRNRSAFFNSMVFVKHLFYKTYSRFWVSMQKHIFVSLKQYVEFIFFDALNIKVNDFYTAHNPSDILFVFAVRPFTSLLCIVSTCSDFEWLRF